MTDTVCQRAVAVGAVVGALNLGHYALTAGAPGLEVPFGIFPGGFPVATATAVAGRPGPEPPGPHRTGRVNGIRRRWTSRSREGSR